MESDSDSDIQEKLEDIIQSNIDELKILLQTVKKNELSSEQISSAYELCLNNYNSLDQFLQKETSQSQAKQDKHTPISKQKKAPNRNKGSTQKKKKSLKDEENAGLKSNSSDSNDENSKETPAMQKQTPTPKQKKKSARSSGAKKMSKLKDDQDMFLQENDE